MSRIWKTSTALAFATSLSTVHFFKGSQVHAQVAKRLPIYEEEEERRGSSYGNTSNVEYEYLPEEITPLRSAVSIARKALCELMDRVFQTTSQVRDWSKDVQVRVQEGIQYLPTQEELVPGGGIVLVSALGGSILAHSRGGIFRRLIYPVLFGSVAAFFTYPKFAHFVTTNTKQYVIDADWKENAVALKRFLIPDVREKSKVPAPTEETANSPGANLQRNREKESKTKGNDSDLTKDDQEEESVTETPVFLGDDEEKTKSSSQDETKKTMEKDFGQSKPQDKSMYSTRSPEK